MKVYYQDSIMDYMRRKIKKQLIVISITIVTLLFGSFIYILFMISLFSCTNKEHKSYTLATGIDVIETANGVLAASQSNELLLLNHDDSRMLYKANGRIGMLLGGDESIVIGEYLEDNSKNITLIDMNGKIIWDIENYKGYFYNSFIDRDTLYLPLSDFHKISLKDYAVNMDIKNQLPVSKEKVISELLKNRNVLFFYELLFFNDKEEVSNFLGNNYSKLYPYLHKISSHTIGFFVDQKNTYLVNKDSLSSLNLLQKSNKNIDEEKHINLGQINKPKLKISDNYVIVYNLKQLSVYSLNDFILLLSISSDKPFIINAFFKENTIIILAKDNLYEYDLVNKNTKEIRKMESAFHKNYDAIFDLK